MKLWCILKHVLLGIENSKEHVADMNDMGASNNAEYRRIQMATLNLLARLDPIATRVSEISDVKGNVERVNFILNELVNAEYHCTERAGVTFAEFVEQARREFGEQCKIAELLAKALEQDSKLQKLIEKCCELLELGCELRFIRKDFLEEMTGTEFEKGHFEKPITKGSEGGD